MSVDSVGWPRPGPGAGAASTILLCLLLLVPTGAEAKPEDEGRLYNGGTLGVGLVAGAELLSSRESGYVAGVYIRANTVMTVFSGQLEYDFAAHELADAGHRVEVGRHSIVGSFNFHPLFLRLFNNDWLWYTLTSWHVQTGLSCELTSLRSPELGLDRNDTALGLHAGSGIEAPLYDPNGAGALWLGLAWRWKLVQMNPHVGGQGDLDAHQIAVTLTYRHNNLSFARVPRPPELRYR